MADTIFQIIQWAVSVAGVEFAIALPVYCWLWEMNGMLAIKCKKRGHCRILVEDWVVMSATCIASSFCDWFLPWVVLATMLAIYPLALFLRIKRTAWPEPILPPSNLEVTKQERKRAQRERSEWQSLKSAQL